MEVSSTSSLTSKKFSSGTFFTKKRLIICAIVVVVVVAAVGIAVPLSQRSDDKEPRSTLRSKKRAIKDLESSPLIDGPVGVRDKSGFAYITCTWMVEFGEKVYKISFSRDTCCVYIDGDPIQTMMLIKDRGYDVHIWWENEQGRFYIFSDVDVDKQTKPMVNYLYINDSLVSKKNYKEHKVDEKEKVPTLPRRPIDIYLQECQLEQQQQDVPQ